MEGGTPLSGGQSFGLGHKVGTVRLPVFLGKFGGRRGVLRRLLVHRPALDLGGGQLGGDRHRPGIGVVPGQALIEVLYLLPLLRQIGQSALGPGGLGQGLSLNPPDVPGGPQVGRCSLFRQPGQFPQGGGLRPGQGVEQNPGSHALLVLQGHGGHGRGHVLPQPLQAPDALGQGQSQNKLLLCPGHGHIEKAQLLGHHLALQLPGHRPAGQGGILHHPLPVQPLGPYSQRGMEQHRTHQIVPVEPPGEAAHQYHRLLQALGAVDGQDGHALLLAIPAAGGNPCPRLLQPLEAE